eukprot:g1617.t1
MPVDLGGLLGDEGDTGEAKEVEMKAMDAGGASSGDVSIQIEEKKDNSKEAFLAEYFAKTEKVKDAIKLMNEVRKQVDVEKDAVEMVPDAKQMEEINNKYNAMTKGVMKDVNVAFAILKQLKELNKKEENDQSIPASERRIKQSMTTMLSQKFIKELTSFRESKTGFENVAKEKLRTMLEMSQQAQQSMHQNSGDNPEDDIDEEFLEKLYQAGEFDKVLKAQFIGNKAMQELKEDLNRVTEEQEELKQIDRDLQMIRSMFMDLEFLLVQEGEMLNNIEASVDKTVEYVSSANDNIQEAIKQNQRSRRLKGCLCLILIIALIALCIPLIILLT